MIVFVPVIEQSETKQKIHIPKYEGISLSLEQYLNWESDETEFKYEWDNGILEADFVMKKEETRIYQNISRAFVKTQRYKEGMELIPEVSCYLKIIQKVRIPDISLFSSEQIKTAKDLDDFTPLVAMEILSPSNSSESMEKKTKEYFQAGVELVWQIFPNLEQVRIYSSDKDITVCEKEDSCYLGSIVPDFQLTVNNIFRL
ncbi:MAG: Uma2 family endonuclease [Leptospiraceae bacterium]|nr:Uma2 family endonuclease [Leptospiraceae bacterium]MCP5494658.1 Uma2 family endonuclease [Leptospiraceae bacterium]